MKVSIRDCRVMVVLARLAPLVLVSLLVVACGGTAPTQATVELLPTQPVSSLTFHEAILQQRKDAVRLSDWESYRDAEVVGKRVHWEGYILHKVAESQVPGMVEIRVELDPRDTLLLKHYDAFFFVPPNQAEALTTGQDIVVDGDIKEVKELGGSVDTVLMVHLTNVIIQE